MMSIENLSFFMILPNLTLCVRTQECGVPGMGGKSPNVSLAEHSERSADDRAPCSFQAQTQTPPFHLGVLLPTLASKSLLQKRSLWEHLFHKLLPGQGVKTSKALPARDSEKIAFETRSLC